MAELKIAIMWHFHQPYYKKEGEFILPWVRLHGVKDYFDLPELFYEFPNLKQTINLVPSLKLQIEEYVNHTAQDSIQRLSLIRADELTDKDKNDIIQMFFSCHYDNMIKPYPRYLELHNTVFNSEHGFSNFNSQDWLDLQTWYNLTWVGMISRENSFIKRLFNKASNFTEEEKQILITKHIEIIEQINIQLSRLVELNQLELSVTPFYHPILPLLCDTDISKESMPNVILPSKRFSYPEDAKTQIKSGLNYFEKIFNYKPTGMWPSEGSISNQTLSLMIEQGIKWVATDEAVLANSLPNNYNQLNKYFPQKYKTDKGEISIFFRDNSLSDSIGFVYSNWNHHDAVEDFYNRLLKIKYEIISKLGESALEHAVVPIILDGENCWEFYPRNGIDFLRAFFHKLSNSNEINTIRFSDIVDSNSNLPAITSIKAGSWINANFNIWIGHIDHRKAWTILANARELINKPELNLSEQEYNNAMEHIYIAEGSDWFWWYGDTHYAPNKYDFDMLFRWHISEIYRIIGVNEPEEIKTPINIALQYQSNNNYFTKNPPVIDGIVSSDTEWLDAAYFSNASNQSTMHQVGSMFRKLWYCYDDNSIYLRIDFENTLNENDTIIIDFISPQKINFILNKSGIKFLSDNIINFNKLEYSFKDIIELSIPRIVFYNEDNQNNTTIEFCIHIIANNQELIIPTDSFITIQLI